MLLVQVLGPVQVHVEVPDQELVQLHLDTPPALLLLKHLSTASVPS